MKTKLIFISGVAGVGKTTISYRLQKKLGVDKVISLDSLKKMAQLFVKKQDEPYLFTTTHSAKQVEGLDSIQAFYKHSQVFEKLLINYLQTLTSEKAVIIEGSQLTPNIIDKINKTKFDVQYFMLLVNDEKVLRKRFEKKLKVRKSNWIEHIDIIVNIQNELLKYDVVKIDNKCIFKTIRKIKRGLNK